VSEWISVEDRLPPDGIRALFVEMGTNYMLISYPHRRLWEESAYLHWMPLPPPPEAK
jgi:hypothetical protein